MADIIINGTSYPLKFGMKFLREVNKRNAVPVEGMKGVTENVGMKWMVAELMDNSVEALADAIFTANKTETPRLTLPEIDEFLDSEETDIDGVFNDVIGFLETANATKRLVQDMKDMVAKKKAEMELEDEII